MFLVHLYLHHPHRRHHYLLLLLVQLCLVTTYQCQQRHFFLMLLHFTNYVVIINAARLLFIKQPKVNLLHLCQHHSCLLHHLLLLIRFPHCHLRLQLNHMANFLAFHLLLLSMVQLLILLHLLFFIGVHQLHLHLQDHLRLHCH